MRFMGKYRVLDVTGTQEDGLVKLLEETLSDGSHAYSIGIHASAPSKDYVRADCVDEKSARMLFDAIAKNVVSIA